MTNLMIKLVKISPAFQGTWSFKTVFSKVRHLSPSWARSIQFMSSHSLKQEGCADIYFIYRLFRGGISYRINDICRYKYSTVNTHVSCCVYFHWTQVHELLRTCRSTRCYSCNTLSTSADVTVNIQLPREKHRCIKHMLHCAQASLGVIPHGRVT